MIPTIEGLLKEIQSPAQWRWIRYIESCSSFFFFFFFFFFL